MRAAGSANVNGEASPRIRNDAATQDIKVGGRHREKLEMIRDSLKPFEQPQSEIPSTSQSQVVTNSAELQQHASMVNALCQAGHDREQAILALRLVNYRSVTSAAEILLNISKDPRVSGSQNELRLNGNIYPPMNGGGPLPQSSGYGSRLTLSSQHSHAYPSTSQIDDNESPRSSSPSMPTTVRSPSPVRHHMNVTPVQQQEYHRSHAHIQLRQSFPGEEVLKTGRSPQQTPPIGHKQIGGGAGGGGGRTTIVIERDKGGLSEQNRIRVAPTTSNNGNSPLRLASSRDRDSIAVIKTRLDRPPPQTTKLQINVEPSQLDPSHRTMYRFDVISSEGCSSVAGVPGGMSGVQSILVDPDQQQNMNPTYVNYMDKLWPRQSRSHHHNASSIHAQDASAASTSEMISNYIGRISPSHPSASTSMPSAATRDYQGNEPSSSNSVVRSVSPLPPSVEQRLKNGAFESVVKPIKPRMFCFFMEQHVERVVQAHQERLKRAHQLSKEMEAANLSENMKEQMLSFLIQKESRYMRLKRQKMNRDMFDMIKHIGVGAFGRVTLVRKKDTGQVYAMKSLLKKDVIVKQQAAHVKAERDILAEANSSWIVKLSFSFQDERCLYFIMEYVPGGDMMQLLINKGIFYEELARFYIAELTCAIEYVHSLGFIHRDIKPDNILIDKDGHIKLTDFGLCTGLRWTHDRRYYGPDNEDGPAHIRVDSFSLPPEVAHIEQHMQQMKVLDVRHQKKRNQAHSVVGTGNYMAPEVIRKTGHTQLCDWWSVGVILYEMVIGRPPFMSMTDDSIETQFKIMNWPRFLDLSCSGHLSASCVQMIRSLICEEKDRIGKERGAHDIKKHSWFRGIDFKTLRQQKAEYIPRVEHAEDTRNFDTIELSESPFETLSKNSKVPNNPAFFEFTFRHFFDYDGQGCPSLRPVKRPSLAPLLEKNGHAQGPIRPENGHGQGPIRPEQADRPYRGAESRRPPGVANKGVSASTTANNNSTYQQTSHRMPPHPSQAFRTLGGLHNTPLHEDEDSGESFIV